MIQLPKPQKFESKLASIIQVSKNVYLERFMLVEPKEITFIPGQTVMLFIAPGINRSMSIASVPAEKNSILLLHDVRPMGPYSKWALAAKAGDPMQFMGPLGVFVLDRESPRRITFVATGTGIAPFYAMAKDYFLGGGTGEIHLYWGLRYEEDIFWQKEFEILGRQFPNFHFTLTLSKPAGMVPAAAVNGEPTQVAWKQGHVQDHIFTEGNILSDTDFYLCGSKEMVSDMRDKLKAAGVPEMQVKFELFY